MWTGQPVAWRSARSAAEGSFSFCRPTNRIRRMPSRSPMIRTRVLSQSPGRGRRLVKGGRPAYQTAAKAQNSPAASVGIYKQRFTGVIFDRVMQRAPKMWAHPGACRARPSRIHSAAYRRGPPVGRKPNPFPEIPSHPYSAGLQPGVRTFCKKNMERRETAPAPIIA